jgi:ferritin-like protein
VIVHNTFCEFWELKPYLNIALLSRDLDIEIIHCQSKFQNIHGVPEAKLIEMSKRFEDNMTISAKIGAERNYDKLNITFGIHNVTEPLDQDFCRDEPEAGDS